MLIVSQFWLFIPTGRHHIIKHGSNNKHIRNTVETHCFDIYLFEKMSLLPQRKPSRCQTTNVLLLQQSIRNTKTVSLTNGTNFNSSLMMVAAASSH